MLKTAVIIKKSEVFTMRDIHTKLVGVTFDNRDGTNRQDVFKKLARMLRQEYQDELYGGITKKEQIEEWYDEVSEFEGIEIPLSCHWYMYDGQKALCIRCEAGELGNISADLVPDVLKLPNAMFYGEITGGKKRVLEGDEVTTQDLTYGMNITIEVNA